MSLCVCRCCISGVVGVVAFSGLKVYAFLGVKVLHFALTGVNFMNL